VSPPDAGAPAARGAARPIAHRVRARGRGPIARLMSPSDLGAALKPFVFLDLFDYAGPPFEGPLHPHSGIATLTWVAEGSVHYVDPDGVEGDLPAGGVEWMQAGRGMWHGGGMAHPGRTRGFQLWVALPARSELGPTYSRCLMPEELPQAGPARILLGRLGDKASPLAEPSPMTYLAVRLRAGERWRYDPPAGHDVLWIALAAGALRTPDVVQSGELVAFEAGAGAVVFEAQADSEFVLGSAAPHPHELVCGNYSVHTSADALREGESRILALRDAASELIDI
jgi:redox-sensitive bicupin YhaK (pirin superfamily)